MCRFNAVANDLVANRTQFLDTFDSSGAASRLPVILAPIWLRKFARSVTSGPQAADSMTVVPLAKQAAIITLSVPSTVEP
jgi:hypothetical protein